MYSQKLPGGRSGRASPLRPLPSDREVAVAVDDVGLAEQRALPLGGLLQQMPPGDGAVVRAVEAAVVHRAPDRFVEIRDQPVRHRDAGQQAEIALRDREGEVDLPRVAPARDLRTAAQDQPVRAAARTDRAEDLVVRRRLEEAGLEMRPQVARPWRLVRQRVAHCVIQAGMVSPSRIAVAGYHIGARARILPPGIAQRG